MRWKNSSKATCNNQRSHRFLGADALCESRAGMRGRFVTVTGLPNHPCGAKPGIACSVSDELAPMRNEAQRLRAPLSDDTI